MYTTPKLKALLEYFFWLGIDFKVLMLKTKFVYVQSLLSLFEFFETSMIEKFKLKLFKLLSANNENTNRNRQTQ